MAHCGLDVNGCRRYVVCVETVLSSYLGDAVVMRRKSGEFLSFMDGALRGRIHNLAINIGIIEMLM